MENNTPFEEPANKPGSAPAQTGQTPVQDTTQASPYGTKYAYPDGYPDGENTTGGSGFAIAALIFGLLSLIGLCLCCVPFITVPIGVVLGIIALAGKRRGKGLAIVGLILCALTVFIMVGTYVSYRDVIAHGPEILTDYDRLYKDRSNVFAEYEASGKIPEYLEKYEKEPDLKAMMDNHNVTIYIVMDALLSSYKSGSLPDISAYMAAGYGSAFEESQSSSEPAVTTAPAVPGTTDVPYI